MPAEEIKMLILQTKEGESWVDVTDGTSVKALAEAVDTPGEYRIIQIHHAFENDDLRAWCNELVDNFRGGSNGQFEISPIVQKIARKLGK